MNLRLSAASLAIVAMLISQSTEAGPFDAWSYGMNITVTGYKEYKPLTNFPVLVELGPSRSGFSYSQFGSPSAADLRFTDSTGTNELSYEIDTWNPSGNSYVWVRVPVLNGTGNTNFWNGQYVHHWSWSGEPFLAQKTAGGVYWLDRRAGQGQTTPAYSIPAQFLRNDGFPYRTSYQFADGDPAGGWTYASRDMNPTRTFTHNQYLGDFATQPNPTPVYAMIYNGYLYAELRWNGVSPGEFWGPDALVNVGITNLGDKLQFVDFTPTNNPPDVYHRINNTNTQPTVIRAYWGNAAASVPAYATNGSVWSGGGWQSVWHMDEAAAIDSRARASVGTSTNVTVTTGRIGSGLGFNPASQSHINFGTYNLGVTSNSSYTIEGWFYRTGVQGSGEDANVCYGSASTRATAGLGVQSDGKYKSIHYGDNKGFDYAPYSSGQWQHIVLVHMGRDSVAGGGSAYMDHLWINGEFMSMAGNAANKDIQDNAATVLNLPASAPLMFGKASWDGTYCGAQTMDEIRISRQFRDTCWIRASYLTVASNSSFQIYSAVSNGVGGFNPSLVASAATWKYYATNSAPAGSWTATNFSDSAWGSGSSAFGYLGSAEPEVLSQIPYGSDSTNKWMTTYYRTTFNLTNLADVSGLLFSLKVDDGAVWYLNGTERGRYNMYEGTLAFTNRSVGGATNSPRPWLDFQVSTNGLKVGSNVIAVEVHQQKPDTSDLFFDLTATAVGYATTNQSGAVTTPGTNPAPASVANWTAYNDMGWIAGQLNANITTNSLATLASGYLVNYLTGSNLPVQVNLGVAGNGAIFTHAYAPPSGSDADLVFGGKVDGSSYLALGTETLTMQFTGLDPAQRYSFAMYGSRGDSNYTYRWSTVTLSGVNSFSNSSSSGSTITTTSLAQDTTKILAANMDGKIFRYDIIDPGSDGNITLTLVPGGSGSTNGYINAFMLGTNSVPTSSGGGSSNPPPSTSGGSAQQMQRNATWRYLDNGPGLIYKPWTQSSYDPEYWYTGVAPFGYAATNNGVYSSIRTFLGYGPMSTNKYTVYYFRRSFLVSNATALGTVTFNTRIDDGAVIYINTNEVYRYNMPAGPITNGMLSAGSVGDATNIIQFTAPSSVFQNGTNIIAVEVHQSGAGSSDLFFDLWSDNLPGPEPIPTVSGASSYIIMDSGWFTRFYNNNPTSAAVLANLDTDGDGQSGWEEYVAGTDPNNAASEFAIVGLRQTNGMNRLTWMGGTNGTLAPYTILFATNIFGPWTELAEPNRADGQNTYDLTPGAIPKGYYKVSAGN